MGEAARANSFVLKFIFIPLIVVRKRGIIAVIQRFFLLLQTISSEQVIYMTYYKSRYKIFRRDLKMPKIKWAGVVQNTADYQSGILPATAIKLEMPDTMGEMMLKAIPFLIPSVVIIVFSVFFKTLSAGQPVIAPLYVILGFLLSFFVGLPVHELLHAIVYPKTATVYIGIMPKQFTAVALASYPISRNRFALMSLLPIVLGIIPLIIFLISPETNRALSGVMFGLMIMGLTSPYPDYFNVYQVLKQTKKGCLLQFEQDDLYAISASDLK